MGTAQLPALESARISFSRYKAAGLLAVVRLLDVLQTRPGVLMRLLDHRFHGIYFLLLISDNICEVLEYFVDLSNGL